jgi:16S rRNA (guanine1207-N2)-methyltransferase
VAEQYFSRRPSAAHRALEFTAVLRGRPFTFHTDSAVFSRREVDVGTRLLIESLAVRPAESLLDLGCGYGPIGVALAATVDGARIVMTDVNRRAVALSRKNADANRVRVDVREGELFAPVDGLAFHHIASNPPIRAGKTVVHGIVEGAPAHLRDGGSLWLVARTAQGAPSLTKKMADVFGNAEVVSRGGGFRVLRAVRPTILK